jgi:Cu(I)/Ag(I) efflux system membrane protein CusA/SilA
VNREAAARYGITVGAIQDVIETAVGESNLMLTIEGRPAVPRAGAVRAAVSRDAEALAACSSRARGTQVPLGRSRTSGPCPARP